MLSDADLATVCWVRAVEQGARGGDGAAMPWGDDDAAWASAEARRAVGDGEGPTKARDYVVTRARMAAQRLAERDPAWRTPGLGSAPWAWRWLVLLAAAALAAYVVGDVFGPTHRINLLAPPVLALLAWNLLVYAALPFVRTRGLATWLGDALEDARARPLWRGRGAPLLAARARFVAEWTLSTRGVQPARVATVLHLAAALLGGLVIASMYVFGVAFDYRAGWDSTWLDAGQVHGLLARVFAPASALSGIGVPPAETIAALRFAEGSPGERAAHWIHLYAITLAWVVVLPRTLLALGSAWHARRLVARRELPLSEPYFRALLRDGPAMPRPVTVLSYSYALSAPQIAALPQALVEAFGRGATVRRRESLPMGAEDDLPAATLDGVATEVVALFAAGATPERETHGAFVQALVERLRGRAGVSVWVDESPLREHMAGASDAALRITQRRAAWQRMLHEASLPAPRFVDLSASPAAA